MSPRDEGELLTHCYRLAGPPIASYVLSGADPSARCAGCGFVVARDVVPAGFSLATAPGEVVEDENGLERPAKPGDKRRWDAAYTFDNRLIVSRYFRQIVERAASTPVRFLDIPTEPKFFLFVADESVEWDRSSVRSFGPVCAVCGQHESIIGSGRSIPDIDAIDRLGIYRSDLEFGEGDGRHPIIVVGREMRHLLRDLRGIHFTELETAI